jgi:hypothetical protein
LAILALLAGLVAGRATARATDAQADDAPDDQPAGADPNAAHGQPAGADPNANDDQPATIAPAADPPPTRRTLPPASATQALDRAAAAYEFGDIHQMIELSRLVAEGALPADDGQRADALRLLGIGLYLSAREDGARRAFIDLLQIRPKARLNPAITRPEVVAFFEEVRRQHGPKKRFALNFLPPLGQLQNEDPGRAALFFALELAGLAGAVTTKVLKESWEGPDLTYSNHGGAATGEKIRFWNFVSVGILAASWAAGVADAILRYGEDADQNREPRLSFLPLPNGAAFGVSF